MLGREGCKLYSDVAPGPLAPQTYSKHIESTPDKSEAPTGAGLTQTGTDSASDVSGAIFCRSTYTFCTIPLQTFTSTHTACPDNANCASSGVGVEPSHDSGTDAHPATSPRLFSGHCTVSADFPLVVQGPVSVNGLCTVSQRPFTETGLCTSKGKSTETVQRP